MSEQLRAPAEIKFAEELDYLESVDDGPRPFSWRLSPRLIRAFVLGSAPADGLDRKLEQKWFGDPGIVEQGPQALGRVARVQRDPRATGPKNRQDTDDQRRRPFHR